MSSSKPSVYSFQDFAALFAAYVEWMKGINSKFSWRWLGKRLGLKSHTHIINFANGTKAPTDEMLVKISDLFGFSIEEYLYAKFLLGLQTARSDSEKIFFQEKLAEIRRPLAIPVIPSDEFGVIAQWYHLVIFELIHLPDFESNAEWISARLRGAVAPEVVNEALDRLERLKLIRRDSSGKITRAAEGIFTTNNIPSGAIAMFHKQMLEQAAVAIETAAVSQRLFFGYTMPVDSSRTAEAQNLLIEFRNRFAILMEGGKADSVYHLGLQFFPTTTLPPFKKIEN